MREIWFRGKRLDNGQWIEGWLIRRTYPAIETTLGYIVTKGRSLVIDTVYPVDPSTAGQYTGLRDKNGKMIFEGDIVQFYGTYALEVFIEHGHTMIRWFDTVSNRKYTEMFFGHDEEEGECEVIGNIHDNPELLKGESK